MTEAGGRCSGLKTLLDLVPRPLPVLQSGFWGTSWVVNRLNACLPPRPRVGEADQSQVADLVDNRKVTDGPATNGPATPVVGNPWGKYRLWIALFYWFVSFGGLLTLMQADWASTTALGNPVWQSCGWAPIKDVSSCGLFASSCRRWLDRQTSFQPVRCPHYCDIDELRVSGGSNDGQQHIYTVDSAVCRAGIHAGLVNDRQGGCMAWRAVGEQASFAGSGISEASNWSPFGIELSAVDSSHCNSVRPWISVYAFVSFVMLVAVVRVGARHALMFMVAQGCTYLATNEINNDDLNRDMIHALNFKSQYLYWLLPLVWFLFPYSAEPTVPDGRRFPLDLVLFYWVPFWVGIRMDDLVQIGFDVTLTSDVLSEPEYVIGFLLLVACAVPLFSAQAVLLYRAGMLRKRLLGLGGLVLAALILSLTSGDFISFHLHHWFFGFLGFVFFQGQPRLRYSLIFNAGLLGAFVNGVVIWGPDPFFDEVESSLQVLPRDFTVVPPLAFSNLQVFDTSVEFEWVTRDTFYDVWLCNDTLSSNPKAVRRRLDVLPELDARPDTYVLNNNVFVHASFNETQRFQQDDLLTNSTFVFVVVSHGEASQLTVVASDSFLKSSAANATNAEFQALDRCSKVLLLVGLSF
jgi:hypothetical protein